MVSWTHCYLFLNFFYPRTIFDKQLNSHLFCTADSNPHRQRQVLFKSLFLMRKQGTKRFSNLAEVFQAQNGGTRIIAQATDSETFPASQAKPFLSLSLSLSLPLSPRPPQLSSQRSTGPLHILQALHQSSHFFFLGSNKEKDRKGNVHSTQP